ncbi:MAG: MFS transporter [Nitriliruptorales bacterium]|nr:MFS transporter [Nitriliruptorales bacterium]
MNRSSAADERPPAGGGRPGWLHPTIVRAAILAIAAGYAQFAVTTVLGEVAVEFGAADTTEPLAEEVGLSTTTLGLGLATIRLAGIGALFASALADRHGRRRMLLMLVGGGLALSTGAAASPGFWVFVAITAAARPLLSATNALVAVVAAEETTTEDRSKAMATIQAAYALGSGTVAVLHGFASLSFRWIFLLSLVPLVLLPLLARKMEEPPLYRRLPPGQRPALPGAIERPLWARLAIVTTLGFTAAIVTGPGLTYLFVYGENVLQAAPSFMSTLVLIAGPTGLVGLLAGRWAADALGRRVSAAGATVLMTGAAILTYGGSTGMLTAGYLLLIFAGGAFGPSGGALLTEVFPTKARATANGWATAAGVVGAVVGLGAFGALADLFGSFPKAALVLWLPTLPFVVLYAKLPETRDKELDADTTVTG